MKQCNFKNIIIYNIKYIIDKELTDFKKISYTSTSRKINKEPNSPSLISLSIKNLKWNYCDMATDIEDTIHRFYLELRNSDMGYCEICDIFHKFL